MFLLRVGIICLTFAHCYKNLSLNSSLIFFLSAVYLNWLEEAEANLGQVDLWESCQVSKIGAKLSEIRAGGK